MEGMIMGILVNRLLIILSETDSGSTYNHIALTFLQNLQMLKTYSINDVAELCDVSKSTISKFVREIGYNDYMDFRCAIEFEGKQFRKNGNFRDNIIGYLQDHSAKEYGHVLVQDLAYNADNLDMANICRLAKDINEYDNVIAVGLMFSETAAIDLQSKLGRVGKFIRTTQNDSRQSDLVRRADENTLIIVFSDSGGFIDRYEMIDHKEGKSVFALTKGKVVMITANHKMAKDSRIAYIVKMYQSDSLHTHRLVYPLITDVLAYQYYALVNC